MSDLRRVKLQHHFLRLLPRLSPTDHFNTITIYFSHSASKKKKKKKKKSIFNPDGGAGGFKGKQIYAVDRSISCNTLIYIMAFRQEGTNVAMMLRLL